MSGNLTISVKVEGHAKLNTLNDGVRELQSTLSGGVVPSFQNFVGIMQNTSTTGKNLRTELRGTSNDAKTLTQDLVRVNSAGGPFAAIGRLLLKVVDVAASVLTIRDIISRKIEVGENAIENKSGKTADRLKRYIEEGLRSDIKELVEQAYKTREITPEEHSDLLEVFREVYRKQIHPIVQMKHNKEEAELKLRYNNETELQLALFDLHTKWQLKDIEISVRNEDVRNKLMKAKQQERDAERPVLQRDLAKEELERKKQEDKDYWDWVDQQREAREANEEGYRKRDEARRANEERRREKATLDTPHAAIQPHASTGSRQEKQAKEAYKKTFVGALQELNAFETSVNAGMSTIASNIHNWIGGAFERTFKGANSMLEQFVLAATQAFIDLAVKAAAIFFLNLITGGGSAAAATAGKVASSIPAGVGSIRSNTPVVTMPSMNAYMIGQQGRLAGQSDRAVLQALAGLELRTEISSGGLAVVVESGNRRNARNRV